jgi:hypothetical protein
MNATEVFFSGTPQQLANAVNNLEASYLYSETGKIVFNVVRQRQPDKVRIRIHTPEKIPHADGATVEGSPIAEIEAHTVPTGTCITLRPGLHREYDPVALRWWEVLLARLRLEGWQVWTAGEQSAQPTERAEDASKIGAPKLTELEDGDPRAESMKGDLRKYLRYHLGRNHHTQTKAAQLVGKARTTLERYRKTWPEIEVEIKREIEGQKVRKV